MTRGPRSAPALVVLALVGAAGLVVWLAREVPDAAHAPARALPARAPRPPAPVELTPLGGASSPAAVAEAIERARAAPPTELEGEAPREAGQVAPAPEPRARDLEPTPTLRGVRGLVRDARTRRPIAGAWITWRVPPPEVCEEVLGRAALVDDPAGAGLISDARGRFDVERLPDDEAPSFTLCAVARGYAPATLRPGLREEVVFDLSPAGALDVRVDEPVDLVLEPASAEAAGPVALAVPRGQRGADGPQRWVVRHLAPGPWRALLGGREVAAGHVVEGQTSRLQVSLPPWVEVEGRLSGEEGLTSVTFSLIEGEPARPAGSFTLEDERFSGRLRAGRYVVHAHDAQDTARRAPGLVEVVPGMAPLRLEVSPADVLVEVRATIGGVTVRDGLGLVALDLPEDDPAGGDLIRLAWVGPDGLHVARAPTGRYALFDGQALVAAEVVVPAGGPLVVHADLAACWVRVLLPPALRDEEVLCVRAALLPEVLARRPALRARFLAQDPIERQVSRAAPRFELRVLRPGRYLLVGQSDLGPLEAWVDLSPGGEATVALPE